MTEEFAGLRVTDVAFDDDFILLTLADGRRTRQPLRWAPALFEATAEQRAHWVATADGLGVNWPALLPPREEGVVDIPNQVWDDRYEAAMARLKDAGWALDALSDEDQQLVALWRMEADINNGGFMQFLCNWGDPTCQLALRALQAMGAVQTHAILAGMRGLLDRLEDDPAVATLPDVFDAMTEQELQALDDLDDAYYACTERLARPGLMHFGPEPV
ncbi:TPA: DUF4375 domain-containing protein [Stenotrophomonas maltophilia]|nr:DUF4375 domain-containing protein [Stenotrophomonas maltophilia]HDS1025335.1 DUF4375 domain-containing protein [Stenotrophomonas maltophilia]HDS1029645.1 DUF4375 domain-containing protein [Stenotrophomonas maltophilia]HDS1034567.1 DUF4375 domain-containing protein [Stenotrophomonas maltophilia]